MCHAKITFKTGCHIQWQLDLFPDATEEFTDIFCNFAFDGSALFLIFELYFTSFSIVDLNAYLNMVHFC